MNFRTSVHILKSTKNAKGWIIKDSSPVFIFTSWATKREKVASNRKERNFKGKYEEDFATVEI